MAFVFEQLRVINNSEELIKIRKKYNLVASVVPSQYSVLSEQ